MEKSCKTGSPVHLDALAILNFLPNSQSDAEFVGVLKLVHEGEPVPKARPRVVRGRTYTPSDVVIAEESLGYAMKSKVPRHHDMSGYFAVLTRFYLSNFRRSDGDNFLKLVLDSGNNIIWQDDTQVVEMHSYVVRGDPNPRTELFVWNVDNPHVLPVCTLCLRKFKGAMSRKVCPECRRK